MAQHPIAISFLFQTKIVFRVRFVYIPHECYVWFFMLELSKGDSGHKGQNVKKSLEIGVHKLTDFQALMGPLLASQPNNLIS